MAESLDWDETVDAVIIGGGGAGMAAAIAAAETDPDADVTLVQKEQELGGVTGVSNGIIAAADTYLQRDRNIDDSWEAHYEDFDKFVESNTHQANRYHFHTFEGSIPEKDNLALREFMTKRAGETVDWLHDLGCEYVGPYSEGHHRVPRMAVLTNDYVDVLSDTLADLGVGVRVDTPVESLVQDDGGRVVGARATHGGEEIALRATNGVVLATGSYINSDRWAEEFAGGTSADPIYEANRGDGHRMAADVGAELRNMDMIDFFFRFTPPQWTGANFADMVDDGAVLVNARGERFVNEVSQYDQIFTSALRQESDEIYVIFDDEIAGKYDSWPNYIATYIEQPWGFVDDYLGTDYLAREPGMDELAEQVGFDTDAFERTIEEYNHGVYDPAGGHYDKYGRAQHRKPLTNYPLYALGPLRPYTVVTHGGVAVGDDMVARNEAGDRIPGLYAAGTLAGDLHLFGHGHNHAWVFTSGRFAGRNVNG